MEKLFTILEIIIPIFVVIFLGGFPVWSDYAGDIIPSSFRRTGDKMGSAFIQYAPS